MPTHLRVNKRMRANAICDLHQSPRLTAANTVLVLLDKLLCHGYEIGRPAGLCKYESLNPRQWVCEM